MIQALKSEFRKLFTIRSTYVLLGICLFITALFAGYIEGFRLNADVTDPTKLAGEVRSAITALNLFIGIVIVLLVTHEYRYNTIMYTLTASNNRLKVLLAKFVVASLFGILATLLFGALSPLLTYAGVSLKGLDMVAQNIPILDLLWRGAFYGWATAMFGFIFALIIRNQVGAIVGLLVLPGIVESLLGMLLKQNASYLPFTAVNSLLNPVTDGSGMNLVRLTPETAVLLTLGYVAIGMTVAAILFQKRDAN